MAEIDPVAVVAGIYGVLATAAAAFERIRNAKNAAKRDENAELVSDAKKEAERAQIHSNRADEYKALWEREHAEYNAYRLATHKKSSDDQSTLLKAQERIAELQSRPDFSDLFEHLKAQSDLTVKIMEAMKEQQSDTREVLSAIKTLVEQTSKH